SEEPPTLNRCGAGSSPAGATGGAATGAVPRLENGWACGPWGFDSLPFRSDPAWSSRYDARLLPARRRFEPCRRSLLPPRSNRVPPGVLVWSWGSVATPPASGAGDRRFDSCRPDLRRRLRRRLAAPQRGRGAAVLASLMSSRPWVRIPPAQSTGA